MNIITSDAPLYCTQVWTGSACTWKCCWGHTLYSFWCCEVSYSYDRETTICVIEHTTDLRPAPLIFINNYHVKSEKGKDWIRYMSSWRAVKMNRRYGMMGRTSWDKASDMLLIHVNKSCICGLNYHLAMTPPHAHTHTHADLNTVNLTAKKWHDNCSRWLKGLTAIQSKKEMSTIDDRNLSYCQSCRARQGGLAAALCFNGYSHC